MNYEWLSNTFDNGIKSLLTLFKVILLSKFSNPVKKIKGYKNNCIILGNGPSLNESIKSFPENVNEQFDLFCVNYFAISDYYEQLKPHFYVTAAPEMWLEDVNDVYKEKRTELFQALINKTTWKVIIFIPFGAKRSGYIAKQLADNTNIEIKYFNTTPVEGFKKLNHFLFNQFLGMPRPHNVIIPSLMIALHLEYRNIYLFGTDHSWLKEISVTRDNTVLINQKHFYDENTAKANPMRKLGKGQRKLHEVLEKFVHSFRSYFVINDFATKKKAKIYNSTLDSFIDAFDKEKPF